MWYTCASGNISPSKVSVSTHCISLLFLLYLVCHIWNFLLLTKFYIILIAMSPKLEDFKRLFTRGFHSPFIVLQMHDGNNIYIWLGMIPILCLKMGWAESMSEIQESGPSVGIDTCKTSRQGGRGRLQGLSKSWSPNSHREVELFPKEQSDPRQSCSWGRNHKWMVKYTCNLCPWCNGMTMGHYVIWRNKGRLSVLELLKGPKY